MKILYITSVFPRPEEGATIYTDLAEELATHGHTLIVVVADGHKTDSASSFSHERGMAVLRVRTGNMYNVGIVTKGISVLTQHHYMKRAISKNLKGMHFDLILFETPPVSTYKIVAFVKKLFYAPAFLMLKDIFPQNGVDLGLYKKGGFIYRYFRRQEKKLYRTSDIIGCMSGANIAYILAHNSIPKEKVVLFPNTKSVATAPEKTKAEIRKIFGIPLDKTVFLFGGNIGIPQSPDYIISCAKALLKEENAFLVIVGRGTHAAYVKNALTQYDNFRILEDLPRDTYERLLFSCDVGLVFLDKRFTIPNFPSRILSYMNAKLPVLAAIDDTSDLRELISSAGCGFCCRSDNTEDFMLYAKRLLLNPDLQKEMGECGFRYFKEHLTAEKSVHFLENYVKSLLAQEEKNA